MKKLLPNQKIMSILQDRLSTGKKIIISGVGSGITARLSEEAKIDLIIVHSAGIMRFQGRSSLGSYLPFFNSNEKTCSLFYNVVNPIINETPIILGLLASDPTTSISNLLHELKYTGVQGITNYPTVSLIDGKFREALEEEGLGIVREVEMLTIAHRMGFLTIGFVCTKQEVDLMLKADVDMICLHLGLTTGGQLGAKRAYTLLSAKNRAGEILQYCREKKADIIRLLAGGPILTQNDLQFMYQNVPSDGFIGGSSFERWPIECEVTNTLQLFKATTALSSGEKALEYQLGKQTPDLIETVKNYVAKNYSHKITFADLCKLTNTSRTHLSSIFSDAVGQSFREYLLNYRLNIASELLLNSDLLLSEVAEIISYQDYPQFSKIFKKQFNLNPTEYRNKFSANKKKNLG